MSSRANDKTSENNDHIKAEAAVPKRQSDGTTAQLIIPLIVAGLAAAAYFLLTPSISPQHIDASTNDSVIVPEIPKVLTMWDPVRVNYTRKLKLDNSDRIYIMRTMSMDPPVFEIEDFVTDDEADTIIKFALNTGLFKSDHTYLDGSNIKDKDKDVNGLSKEEAEKLFRYSEQAWMAPTRQPKLRGLVQRSQRLGRVPDRVMQKSEAMQIVHYVDWGHYESHYDSEGKAQGPCCVDPVARGKVTGVTAIERPLSDRCRLCRYMTILYYLVDTEEGGETIFPLADTTEEQYAAWERADHVSRYKQTRTCSPGLVVKPKKGKAVLWYNHKLDRGFLGEKDKRSLHGGCNVIKGQKWIANQWISETEHPAVPRTDATHHY